MTNIVWLPCVNLPRLFQLFLDISLLGQNERVSVDYETSHGVNVGVEMTWFKGKHMNMWNLLRDEDSFSVNSLNAMTFKLKPDQKHLKNNVRWKQFRQSKTKE